MLTEQVVSAAGNDFAKIFAVKLHQKPTYSKEALPAVLPVP